MENQHRKISGYRELSQEEIDLMNEIKAKGVEIGHLVNRVKNMTVNDSDIDEHVKWSYEAEISLRTGIMQLIRSVALPGGF